MMFREPAWLNAAKVDEALGILEIAGSEHHPRIIEYHAHTNLHASTDEVPWCSSAVCTWLQESGYVSTRSARARSWLRWGLALLTPALGCVVVIQRGGGNQPGPKDFTATGHVGLLTGWSDTQLEILGGNQSNRVCTKTYPIGRLLGYRWPDHLSNA